MGSHRVLLATELAKCASLLTEWVMWDGYTTSSKTEKHINKT